MRVQHLTCSFILPHREQYQELHSCLDNLMRLDLRNWSEVEIIVIDNGSLEWDSAFWRAHYPKVRFEEYRAAFNPYICRNLGISYSSLSWIALIDVRCRIKENWLQIAAKAITRTSALIAGRVEMEYPNDDISTKVHGMLYLLNERNHRHKRGFPAGNLLVRRDLFDQYGSFETQLPTGNDILWTRKLLAANVEMNYEKDMLVYYCAKTFDELELSINKYAWGVSNQLSMSEKWLAYLRSFLPMRPDVFLAALKERNLRSLDMWQKIRLYGWIWWAKLLYGASLWRPMERA